MHRDRLQGPINLSISLSFLREARDYHLLGHQERSPRGQHTAHALPAGSHQEVRREPANTFPVIISPPQNDCPRRGWGRGGGSGPRRRARAGVFSVPTPRAAGQGAAAAQLGLGGSGRWLRSSPWEGRVLGPAAGRGGPSRPDTLPGPLRSRREEGAARTLPVSSGARPATSLCSGRTSVSLALAGEYHLSAHTPFAGRQPGL